MRPECDHCGRPMLAATTGGTCGVCIHAHDVIKRAARTEGAKAERARVIAYMHRRAEVRGLFASLSALIDEGIRLNPRS